LNRRRFVQTTAAMLATAACRPAIAVANVAPRRRLDRIGIQIYSVRKLLDKDLDASLSQLATIGYRDVEWWGKFGHTPTELRAALDRAGLKAPSGHYDFVEFRDKTTQCLEKASTLGHEYATAGWIDAKDRRTLGDWQRLADEMNRFGEQSRSAGLRFAFHTHDYVYWPVAGQVPMDLLLALTDPRLVAFELDIYWAVSAGKDPLQYIRKYPGRFVMLHVKDSAGPPKHDQVDVGSGQIAFAPILSAVADQGSLRHVFVEHDEPADPMQFARRSFDYLKRLEF
jgi:sugar phosphate isomerase/epimerase